MLAMRTSARNQKTTPKGNSLPDIVHAKATPPGRIIVVGDVHGCLEELQALLTHVEFRKGRHGDDALMLVGDLVNKGPDSAGVLAAAQKLNALTVRGNHDDSAIAEWHAHRRGDKSGRKDADWVKGLTHDDVAWMEQQPFTLRLRESLCIVHAGLVPGIKLKQQRLKDLYTMRDVIPCKSGWRASEQQADTGKPWALEWKGSPMARHVIFGHDAKRRLQLQRWATGLDTGCVYGDRLTACVIPRQPPPLTRLRSALRSLFFGESKEAPTLNELGATIVSVPSQQPPEAAHLRKKSLKNSEKTL